MALSDRWIAPKCSATQRIASAKDEGGRMKDDLRQRQLTRFQAKPGVKRVRSAAAARAFAGSNVRRHILRIPGFTPSTFILHPSACASIDAQADALDELRIARGLALNQRAELVGGSGPGLHPH